ncbi:D-alanyl-D-alanine carboxypeptidase family protein [Inquilinus limosus]|uniref:D-alanyl-D-alanine carboxypeptidase family protein n=1 Tax=Inquilinus limosus TaxID=171674 RepID=UPI00068B8396|nr:D-alanyl-D-alanine carboxypeptidase family protein [Inquilinus limosus]
MARFFARSAAALLACLALALLLPAQAGAAPRFAAYVIDARTGEVLHEENANQQLYPASLTKLMTLYLTFRALDKGDLTLDTRLAVSSYAASQSPTKLGLPTGSRIRVEDAVLGLVTQSANDASVVLAEAIGGSESRFTRMMTQQARALGMSRTNFSSTNGLPDPDNVSTAHDMAVLARALISDYPQYYPYFATKNFRYRGRNFPNHNRLMQSYAGMDGMKTGYIRAAGYNLVASAVRGRTRLIGVIFGGTSPIMRNAKMAELLDEAFESHEGTGAYVAQAPAAAAPRVASSGPFAPPLPDRRPDDLAEGTLLAAAEGEGDAEDDGAVGTDGIGAMIAMHAAARPRAQKVAFEPVPRALADVPLPKPRPLRRHR